MIRDKGGFYRKLLTTARDVAQVSEIPPRGYQIRRKGERKDDSRTKPGRKTASLQPKRPPRDHQRLIRRRPWEGFGFRKPIIITLPLLEVVMNMY